MHKIDFFFLDFNPDHHPRGVEMLEKSVIAFMQNHNLEMVGDVYMINQGGNDAHISWHQDLSKKYGHSLILLRDNIGISGGINLAARICKSEFMCLITSDALFTKRLDYDCIELFDDSSVGIVIPVSDKSDVEYQAIKVDEHFGAYEVNLPRTYTNKDTVIYELTIVFYRKEMFSTVGYYDERWRAGYENMDYAIRAKINGYSSIITSKAFCWHYGHGCYQTGSIAKAYDGYMDGVTNGGGSPETKKMWIDKWGGLDPQLVNNGTISIEDIRRNFPQNV